MVGLFGDELGVWLSAMMNGEFSETIISEAKRNEIIQSN